MVELFGSAFQPTAVLADPTVLLPRAFYPDAGVADAVAVSARDAEIESAVVAAGTARQRIRPESGILPRSRDADRNPTNNRENHTRCEIGADPFDPTRKSRSFHLLTLRQAKLRAGRLTTDRAICRIRPDGWAVRARIRPNRPGASRQKPAKFSRFAVSS
jgi:hypothetical protein